MAPTNLHTILPLIPQTAPPLPPESMFRTNTSVLADPSKTSCLTARANGKQGLAHPNIIELFRKTSPPSNSCVLDCNIHSVRLVFGHVYNDLHLGIVSKMNTFQQNRSNTSTCKLCVHSNIRIVDFLLDEIFNSYQYSHRFLRARLRGKLHRHREPT